MKPISVVVCIEWSKQRLSRLTSDAIAPYMRVYGPIQKSYCLGAFPATGLGAAMVGPRDTSTPERLRMATEVDFFWPLACEGFASPPKPFARE